MREIGKINAKLFENEFGKLLTEDVVLTDEREEHIRINHPLDYPLFDTHCSAVVGDPDEVLLDGRHAGTVFLIKRLEEENFNVVLRLALEADDAGRKNSIMTFFRVRDKNLAKLEAKNKRLYKRE